MPGQRADEVTRFRQILDAAFVVAVRDRLEGLTIRAVAKEAGLSSGLVHFHFTNRETLLLELLDWLLEQTIIGLPSEEVASQPTAKLRLLAFVRREFLLLPERRPRLELFFDFWVAGFSNKKIRDRIRIALQGYRDAILPMAEGVLCEEPERFPGMSGVELAGLVVAIIEGFVMQTVVEPRAVDLERLYLSVQALLAPELCSTAQERTARGRPRRLKSS